ncbi:exonuclease RecJ [Hathewaya proteolytica DSM 3090]|uniref:Single-stranded-DNA-specific exonuclease RecJ n=1 Tax=Hathewaya proteolytica DSM 3090 TaxID=1121331 RepID=A0A1M6LDN5_9CLOT|nr:single-stranded-DNA-specific exonuclease RecJ [Hathewaya proteolytica]SHJ69267.1 exonuclease RecJ [Hathewaya proteolytica DSM 3090]
MESIWMIKNFKGDLGPLSRKTKISPSFLKVLFNRGIKDENEIKKFFNGTAKDLYEPYMLMDMEKAVKTIKEAIEEKKRIAIYGDYDADGVSSTVILYKGLRRCGADVIYYVPNREEEGYGMSKIGIDRLKKLGANVIITCDNGISAMEEIDYAREMGIPVVLTDHHQPSFVEKEDKTTEEILPAACAVVAPHRRQCTYPFKYLCGAAISYKFIQALFRLFNINNDETIKLLQYAAVGTICDVVDLQDENRIIVKEGLRIINSSPDVGIRALIKQLNLADKEIKCYNIGFNIGPCINATGRLETADIAIELFLSEDEKYCEELAGKLVELNKQRQEMTDYNVTKIMEELSERENVPKVLVLYNGEVHESIAGIVAGRIKDRYNLPTLVITDGKEMPKGSGRSIEKYNMFEELQNCKGLLHKFGGHPMAAGLSIKKENIEELSKCLNQNCTLTDEDIKPVIHMDDKLPLDYMSPGFQRYVEQLEPYGKGNSKPLFGVKNAKVLGGNVYGKNKNVLKLNCEYEQMNIQIISYEDMMIKFKEMLIKESIDFDIMLRGGIQNLFMDFVIYTDINEYMGRKSVQLKCKDLRFSN